MFRMRARENSVGEHDIFAPRPIRFRVDPSAKGHRLSRCVAEQVEGLSVRAAKELVDRGRVFVDNRRITKASTPVEQGQWVEVYPGRLWLEVFLLSGITGMEGEVRKMADLARPIRPDLVQLMTVTRPAPTDFADPVPAETLKAFERLFDVPTVAVPPLAARHVLPKAGREEILRLLERRPCTIQDIAVGLGMPPSEAEKYVADLDAHGRLRKEACNGSVYFAADPSDHSYG